MTNQYQKDSIGWQVQQWQQRLGEWWELKTSNTFSDAETPAWLLSPLLEKVVEVIFWFLVILIISWLVWQIWQLVSPYLYNFNLRLSQQERQPTRKEKKELSAAGWLTKANQFKLQGNYQEACICIYLAMLQYLHEQSAIPHQFSRTDEEYLRLVQQLPNFPPYQTILLNHQQLCFGNAQASSKLVDELQQAYRQIVES